MMQSIQQNQETGRMLEYVKRLQDTLNFLENLSKPTIAYEWSCNGWRFRTSASL